MKLFVLSLVFFNFSHFAQAALPAGYCQVGCTGTSSVGAFDFFKKATQAGDPNGGPLKPITLIPADEGQAPSQSVSTNDLLGNVQSTENWSSSQCGKSLNDDSWSSVQVIAPCGSNALLDRKAALITSQHAVGGANPPSKPVANNLYNQASSPAAQANLSDKWFCRFQTVGGSNEIKGNDCKPYNMTLGSASTVAIGMTSKACRNITTPGFIPEVTQPVGGGFYACRKGMPEGSLTATTEEATFGAWVLGFSLPLLKTVSAQVAPLKKDVTHASQNFFMGSSLCAKSVTSKNIAYDEVCPAYNVHQGTSATFTVGPIPITVEAGGEGSLAITHFARVTPMWSNARVTPGIYIGGYASAYVNLVIAKGGVEAFLTILNETYDIYGFSSSAYLPTSSTLKEGFYYTYQLSAFDTINTLSGHIDAFAKIPVPKFIGWKWKKYVFTIFSWAGLTTQGYVFNDAQGPINVANVK